MQRRTLILYWPTFLHPIFVELGKAMRGRQLHPIHLENLTIIDDESLSGHRWEIRHVSGADAKPAGNRYIITINGPRIKGQWAFRSGELTALAREATGLPNG